MADFDVGVGPGASFDAVEPVFDVPLGDPARSIPGGGKFGGRAILDEVARIGDELIAVDFDFAPFARKDGTVQGAAAVRLLVGDIEVDLNAVSIAENETGIGALLNRPKLDRAAFVGAQAH